MAGRFTEAEQHTVGVDSYYAASTTRTKASTTLFVSFRDAKPPVPKEQRAAFAEGLFHQIPGYVGVRARKGICFIDFESIKASTAGMMRFQGRNGLTVDYDKDVGVAGKRQREQDANVERGQREAASCDYYCSSCGTKALRTNGALLSNMPARSTDGARVVDEAAAITSLLL